MVAKGSLGDHPGAEPGDAREAQLNQGWHLSRAPVQPLIPSWIHPRCPRRFLQRGMASSLSESQ